VARARRSSWRAWELHPNVDRRLVTAEVCGREVRLAADRVELQVVIRHGD
jgi:hypothetical protein